MVKSDTIIIIGALVVGYYIFKGLITPTSSCVTPECPQGAKYNVQPWETCATNYQEECPLGICTGVCDCLSCLNNTSGCPKC